MTNEKDCSVFNVLALFSLSFSDYQRDGQSENTKNEEVYKNFTIHNIPPLIDKTLFNTEVGSTMSFSADTIF